MKANTATVEGLRADIDSAEQALAKASAAMCCLSKNDVNELKRFPSPPAGVKAVLEMVCIIMDGAVDPDANYFDIKKRLCDPTFLSNLSSLDANSISPVVRAKLGHFVSQPNMSPERMSTQSCAATSFCRWVHALAAYDAARDELESKHAALLVATPWWQLACMRRLGRTSASTMSAKAANATSKVAPTHTTKGRRTASKPRTSSNHLALAKPPAGGNDAPFPLTRSYISDAHFDRANLQSTSDRSNGRCGGNGRCCVPSSYASVEKEDAEWLLEPAVARATTSAADLRRDLPDGYGTGAGFDTALPPSGLVWPMAEGGVVAFDTPTDAQLAVMAKRAHVYGTTDGPVSARGSIWSKKLVHLAKRVGQPTECSGRTQRAVPPPAFFEGGLRT